VAGFGERFGPWALVTGAANGIGRAITDALLERGLMVAAVDVDAAALGALESEARGRVRSVPCDLSEPEFLPGVEQAVADLEIGLLVNNAGVSRPHGRFHESSLAGELLVLHVNCRASLVLTRTFVPPMVERGRGGVVFLSSMSAFQGSPFAANYAGTKAWGLQMAEAMEFELTGTGVSVLAVAAGATDTEVMREFREASGRPMSLMDPRRVAQVTLDRLPRGGVVVPGAVNRLSAGLLRALPRRWAAAMVGRRLTPPAGD
jgi:short-subunit dehydrogenase